MMTNLFSSFDPTSNIPNIPMNWLSTLLGLLMLPSSYWLIPNRSSLIWNLLINKVYKEFKTLLIGNKNMGSLFMFILLFSIILFNNFLGLFPYILTSSGHVTFTLSLALPFLLSFMLYGGINYTHHMFAHLLPQGTPSILMPFMVCIETISNIIRPLTLAVRLAANMNAGHLLLTLLRNTGPMTMNSAILIQILILSQILLLILELAVSVIQFNSINSMYLLF